MKKIISLTVIFCFIFSNVVFAQSTEPEMPKIKLMGSKYTLYYSAKSQELGSYINEYYKEREGYSNWTELLALHHYPNAFYPIEHAKAFQNYLNEKGIPVFIEINEEDNSAMVDFIIINNKKLPIILEFNIFRYEKSPVCGTVGLQYAKRYLLSNGLEADLVKREFAKNRHKYIKNVKKLHIPELVAAGVEEGKYLSAPSKEEKVVIEQEHITREEKEFFHEDKLLNIKTDNIEQNQDISADDKKETVKETNNFVTNEEKDFFKTNTKSNTKTDNKESVETKERTE